MKKIEGKLKKKDRKIEEEKVEEENL